MKQLLVIALLIIGVAAVPAQKEGTAAPDKPVCSLNTGQAPVISGVRLGMTAEQVLALFPGSGEDPEVRSGVSNVTKFGVSSFAIKPDKYRSEERRVGKECRSRWWPYHYWKGRGGGEFRCGPTGHRGGGAGGTCAQRRV